MVYKQAFTIHKLQPISKMHVFNPVWLCRRAVRAPDTSSGVSDQQCGLESWSIASFGWNITLQILCTRMGKAHKIIWYTLLGMNGAITGVSGSHSKHPCLQVSSDLQVTVIKFTSLASLPEIYNNKNTNRSDCKQTIIKVLYLPL